MYVRDGSSLFPVVTNREFYQVYAEPNKIQNVSSVIDAIVPVLGLTDEEWHALVPKLSVPDDPYEPIKSKVSKENVDRLSELAIPGIGFAPETYRYYPDKSLGGHIFGFLGVRNDEKVGQYGLEGYFNQQLAGTTGEARSFKDALGALITVVPRSIREAQDGDDLVLTIDRQIQFQACAKLKQFFDSYQAESGTVIIMHPKTGAILAMCSLPDFDPEHYSQVENINVFNNPATFQAYEPGSVFKTLTMAAALDREKITPETTYEDTGELKVGQYTIRNFDLQAYGTQTMTQALAKSLNLGAMHAAEQIGRVSFERYIKAFGFGERTGIELDSESPGNISNLSKPGDIFYLTGSYGYSITATPIQLAAAYAAIANNGLLIKPHVVAERIDQNGNKYPTEQETIRQVISRKTATILTGMLTEVVESSYDKKARVPGYYMAAKTGTARIPSGGGYSNETVHTIVGYGPVTNPEFVILVKIDKIKNGPVYASDSVGPLFSQIAKFLVSYLELPPDY